MIAAKGLCKVFVRNIAKKKGIKRNAATKEEFYAVDHVNFEAKPGEILGILGPNGAGKTTVLRMLGNLMTPTEGEVFLSDADGRDITSVIEKKHKIGYLSGNTKLYQRLSTREMLRVFGDIYGLDKKLCEERINEIFKVLDMESFGDNRIEKLSTGQTQRANIARCLIHNPEVYIFDEPTLGLDILSSEAIVSFMKKEKEKGKTVLYSTHYMEEAQYLCDRIVMLYQGKVIAAGTPKDLMEQTGTDNLRDTFRSLMKEEETDDE